MMSKKPKLKIITPKKIASSNEVIETLQRALKLAKEVNMSGVAVTFATAKRSIKKRQNIFYAIRNDIANLERMASNLEDAYELIQQDLDRAYE